MISSSNAWRPLTVAPCHEGREGGVVNIIKRKFTDIGHGLFEPRGVVGFVHGAVLVDVSCRRFCKITNRADTIQGLLADFFQPIG